MPTINQLSSVDTLAVGDQFPVFSSSNGDARKASGSALLALIKANFASPDYTTILVAPTVSGFVQPIGATSDNVWLIINAAADLAAGTVQLPPATSAIDGQQVLVVTQNAISALSITSAGATVVGAPNTIGDGGFVSLRHSKDTTSWYTTASAFLNGTLPSITLTSTTGGSIKDVNGAPILDMDPNYVAPAVGTSYLRVRNRNSGGGSPSITAVGTDTDIGVTISGKGAGAVLVTTTGGSFSSSGAGSTAMFATSAINLNAPVVNATNLVLPGLTLAELNAAALAAGNPYGMRGSCTDSTTAVSTGNFSSTFAGGGANKVPCWFDGSVWRIG